MLTIILPVITNSGYSNLKQSLTNIIDELRPETNILCITNNKDLYTKCRDLLPQIVEDRENQFLVEYSEKKKLLNESKKYLNQGKLVFIWDENIVIQPNTISGLLSDYSNHRAAGFITGLFTEYPIRCQVKNIYPAEMDDLKTLTTDEISLFDNRLNQIDIYYPYGLMTRFDEFMNFNWNGKEEYLYPTLYQYGIELRQQGYMNYLDTNIKYKYGKNKEQK